MKDVNPLLWFAILKIQTQEILTIISSGFYYILDFMIFLIIIGGLQPIPGDPKEWRCDHVRITKEANEKPYMSTNMAVITLRAEARRGPSILSRKIKGPLLAG